MPSPKLSEHKQKTWQEIYDKLSIEYTKEKDKEYDESKTPEQNKERYCHAVANAAVKNVKSETISLMWMNSEDQRLVSFVVLTPDAKDKHGHRIRQEAVKSAMVHFMSDHQNYPANNHRTFRQKWVETNGNFPQYGFKEFERCVPIENYITTEDKEYEIGNQKHFVRKGSWVQTVYVKDDNLWNDVRRGNVHAVSVEYIATVKPDMEWLIKKALGVKSATPFQEIIPGEVVEMDVFGISFITIDINPAQEPSKILWFKADVDINDYEIIEEERDMKLQSIKDLALDFYDGVCSIMSSKSDKPKKPSKYSDVPDGEFADPENYKYPVNTAARCKSALSYFSQYGDSYPPDKKAKVYARIVSACKKFGIEISGSKGGEEIMAEEVKTTETKVEETKPTVTEQIVAKPVEDPYKEVIEGLKASVDSLKADVAILKDNKQLSDVVIKLDAIDTAIKGIKSDLEKDTAAITGMKSLIETEVGKAKTDFETKIAGMKAERDMFLDKGKIPTEQVKVKSTFDKVF